MIKFRLSATALIKQLGDKLSMTFAQWLADNKPASLWHTCATCHHCEKKGPMFCKKFNLVPPVDVIVGNVECEAYSDESEIPF